MLKGYCHECAGIIDVRRFGATAEDDFSVAIYNRVYLECGSTLRLWKRYWTVLSRCYIRVLIDTSNAGTLVIR